MQVPVALRNLSHSVSQFSQFTSIPGCAIVVLVCVCARVCCGADIVSLTEVAMTPADVAFRVCVYVDVMSITLVC